MKIKAKKCIDCKTNYIHIPGKGTSPRRCPNCRKYKKSSKFIVGLSQSRDMLSGPNRRPMGHRTRGIHKRVPF